jgi:hypothetical protein
MVAASEGRNKPSGKAYIFMYKKYAGCSNHPRDIIAYRPKAKAEYK